MIKEFKIEKNTFEEWVDIKNQIEDAITTNVTDENSLILITVKVNDIDYIENLIFYFPILDMLQDMNYQCRLNIQFDEEINREKNLDIRVRHFLYIQQLFRGQSQNSITINGDSRRMQTRFGTIQPLMAVSNKSGGKFNYYNLYHSELDYKPLVDIIKYYIEEQFSKDSSDYRIKNSNRLKQLAEKPVFRSEGFFEINADCFAGKSNTVKWGKLFNIGSNDSVQEVYAKLTLSNIFYAINLIKGKKDKNSLTKDEKKTIAGQLVDNIAKTIYKMPVLAQYVWSLLLRFHLEAKNMIAYSSGIKSYYQSLFDTTLAQAQALSDGLYQLIENACLHSKSGTGYYYLRIHKTYISNDFSGDNRFQKIEEHVQNLQRLNTRYSPLEFSGDIRFYIEFKFIDNAFDRNGLEGMVEHFNRINVDHPTAHSLKDLFWRKPESIDDLTIHYGLRVMERTVWMNEGAFMVYTPSALNERGGYAYRSVYPYTNEDYDPELSYYHGTLYQVVLPINNAIAPVKADSSKAEVPLFDFSDWTYEQLPYLVMLDGNSEYSNIENKVNSVNIIYNQLEERLHEIKNIDRRIVCIFPKNFALNHMELLAKALIKYLLKHRVKKQYFALLLNSKYQITEFMRTYTAFFDRSGLNYDHFNLENTQIALCWQREENGEQKQDVCFVLSGNDLVTARQTMKNYLYYNSEVSIQFLPLVSYLTSFIDNRNTNVTECPIFPFDLYLDIASIESYSNDKVTLDKDNIWFIKHINSILDTDMQSKGYGCKLSNVHVSLGSKIHTDTFYNAELIFHNYANIFRFAYMIAKDILNEHIESDAKHKKKDRQNCIVLVAYGEYSQLLIQKVCDLINSTNMGYRAVYIVFPSYLSEEEQREWRLQGKDFLAFLEAEHINTEDGLSNYCFYTVVPISTTLSTIKKIHETLERTAKNTGLSGIPNFGINISLIISGGIDDSAGIKLNYWERVDPVHRLIVIKGGEKVKYYINKPAKWYKIFDTTSECELCTISPAKKSKSLIGVDKSSTLPDAIFDTLNRSTEVFGHNKNKNKNENDKRLEQLYANIRYSHISSDQNHYQYDIDYEKYCRNEKNNESIRKWLINDVRPELDTNGFSIVVSPLDTANSRFLKNVLECAFNNSSRVINIKFHTAYRDEIRSKLDFITEEYKQIQTSTNSINVNVYYVDDCIIEGATFQRSKQFLYMLFSDAGLNMDRVSLYEGIILLSNRSSFDTIQNLLPGRVKSSFFYYMRLNVPSFNTQNRICPACTLSEQYRLMKKRASTSIIAGEYDRLYHKHLPKSRSDYNKWMDSLLREKGNFSKFKTWLYYAVQLDEKKDQFYMVDIQGNKTFLNDSQYPELNKLNACGLDSILSGAKSLVYEQVDRDFLDMSAEILRKHIIADRDYCRMICTHEIFTVMEKIHNDEAKQGVASDKYESDLRDEILKLIRDRIKIIEKGSKSLPIQTQFWLKAEWIISYFKIISRKQPAHYYHLRNTIYNILIEFLDCIIFGANIKDLEFLTNTCELSADQNYDNCIMPDMKYRIFITAVRRLSAMHSSYLIEKIDGVFSYYQHCLEQNKAVREYHHFFKNVEKLKDIYHSLVDFPDQSLFNLNIAKLTKWSSTYGVDDSKCFIVEKLIGNKLNGMLSGAEPDEYGMVNALKIAFMENTQVIYTGIKKLLMNCFVAKDKKDSVTKYIKQEIDREVEYQNKGGNEMSTHRPYFRFTHFQDIMRDYEKKDRFCEQTARMLMLFSLLCSLETASETVDNPYDFVHICNYIRDITGYEQCKIFSYREQIVSQIISSDIAEKYFFNDIEEDTIRNILSKFCENINDDYDFNKVAQKYLIGGKTEVMIVSLLNPAFGNDTVHIPKYYLVLYKNEFDHDSVESDELTFEDLKKLRSVLFLRDRLEIVLQKNIAELIGMINSYDYIKPLVKNRVPVILHISDLHIKAKDKNKTIPDYAALKDAINADPFSKIEPDLLLITGDVIWGNYSAAGLQDTYENALMVIKEIAVVLWSDDYGNIRSDWNKRIQISVGNHDYASMNELEATSKKRITTSGKPGELGDVMIKHSYFVHFLHRLLENDIDTITKYDMNHVINYNKLGISVININSNSNVNPLRTNKVRIDKTAVDKSVANTSLSDTIVYMMHHTPIYRIDYVDDVYYLSYGESTINQITATIKKAYTDRGLAVPKNNTNEIWIALLKSFENYLSDKVFDLPADGQKQLVKDIIEIINQLYPSKNGDDKYKDFSYFIDCEDPKNDDRCRRLVFELSELENASKGDQKEYVEFAKDHFGWIMDLPSPKQYIILGGHTHQLAKYTSSMSVPLSGCKGVYEAGKFYEIGKSGLKLSYFVFSVGSSITMTASSDPALKEKDITGSVLDDLKKS